MDPRFSQFIEALDASHRRLLKMRSVKVTGLPAGMPQRGVYLLSEQGKCLYVGRSNRMRGRLQTHSRPGSRHNQAHFAFLLACEPMRRGKASYRPVGSRASLAASPEFAAAFDKGKARVRAMDIRFVEEKNPTRQALLEIYVAVVLKTPYNDFDTH